jgi:hypothetical protein
MIEAKKHPAMDPVERGMDGFSRALNKDHSVGNCPEADGAMKGNEHAATDIRL